MNQPLDSLRGQDLPELSPTFRIEVEARVLPLVKRRRFAHRIKVSITACLMASSLAYMYIAVPWQSIEKPSLRDLTQFADNLMYSNGSANLGITEKPLEELLELRRELEDRQGRESGSMTFIPIQNFVEWADHLVQGVVEEVTVDRDALIEDIKARRVMPIFLTARLRVVQSHPPLEREHILVSSTGDPDRMRVGDGFLMALKSENDTFRPMYSFGAQGVYSIQGEGDDATVSGLVTVPHTMSVKQAWELIRNLYVEIHDGDDLPDAKILETRIDTLKYGTLEDAALALQYLSVANRDLLDADLLLEALEKQYDRLLESDEVPQRSWGPARHRIIDEVNAYCGFTREILPILYLVSDKDSVSRLLELYIHDMSNVHNRVLDASDFANGILRSALKHPGPDRRERVLSLLGKEVSYYDLQGNRVGGVILVPADYLNLEILAKTPGDDVEKILMDVLKNPEAYNPWGGNAALGQTGVPEQDVNEAIIRIRRKTLDALEAEEPSDILKALEASIAERNGKTTWFPSYIKHRMRPGDTSLVAIMQKFSIESVADVIWLKVPEPEFVPALRQAIGKNRQSRYSPLLQAFHACGESAEALTLAGQLLKRRIDDSNLDNFESDVAERIEVLRYLGRVGNTVDTDVVSLIRPFLSEELPVKYDEGQRRAYQATLGSTEPNRRQFMEYRSLQRHPLSVELETTALLALTRLHDPGIVQKWENIYKENDIRRRMTAAIALYYLGDDMSKEYVQAFRNHAERGIKELRTHTASMGWTGDFQRAIMYLRSPKVDALFLDRLDKGLDHGDSDPLVYDVAFIMDHAERVLHSLSAHLDSKDMMTRNTAHSCLESILGLGTKWNTLALAGTQPEVVEQLRAGVESFISANMILSP